MSEFIYTGWFRDQSLHSDEQDHEWCACFVIEADTKEKAIEWGNRLSEKHSEKVQTEIFFSSSAEQLTGNNAQQITSLPRLRYGEYASDEIIGW